MTTYQVLVGNIGTVYTGNDVTEADSVYDEYLHQSLGKYGRASGESVILLENDVILRELTRAESEDY